MGWAWIGVSCLACRRQRQRRFDSFAIADAEQPIGRLALRFRCTGCQGRTFTYDLGTDAGTGDRWSRIKQISFEGSRTASTRRN